MFRIVNAIESKVPTFAITDTKLFIPVATLSTSVKLLEHLKSGSKRTYNCNKYQSKAAIQTQNKYLDYLIDPSFQGVIRLFVLYFENNCKRSKLKAIFTSSCRNKRLESYG